MNAQRAPFLSGILLGLGVGLILSHFWFPRHHQTSQSSPPRPVFSDRIAILSSESDPAIDELLPPAPFFPALGLNEIEENPDSHPLQNALALETTAETLQKTNNQLFPENDHREPDQLDIRQAAPLNQNSTGDQATIRGIIDIELNHLSPEKRDVWFDALKDVNKEDVAGILRMWKLLGGPIPEAPMGFGAIPVPSPAPEFDPSPAIPPAAVPDFISDRRTNKKAAQLAKDAKQILELNLLLQNTPGYVPQTPSISGTTLETMQVKGRHEFLNYRHVATGFPLDLAIEGPGFFEVIDENGDRFLTRNGRFTLNEHNTLVLKFGGQELKVANEVTLPDGWNAPGTQLIVLPSGQVQLKTPNAENSKEFDSHKQGEIAIRLPVSPDQLELAETGFYRLPAADWKQVQTLSPSQIHIQSGVIELPGELPERSTALIGSLEKLANPAPEPIEFPNVNPSLRH